MKVSILVLTSLLILPVGACFGETDTSAQEKQPTYEWSTLTHIAVFNKNVNRCFLDFSILNNELNDTTFKPQKIVVTNLPMRMDASIKPFGGIIIYPNYFPDAKRSERFVYFLKMAPNLSGDSDRTSDFFSSCGVLALNSAGEIIAKVTLRNLKTVDGKSIAVSIRKNESHDEERRLKVFVRYELAKKTAALRD